MSNLQIKGIDEGLYQELKQLAADESRSVSQQVLFLIRRSLAERRRARKGNTPAQVLLTLAGSWEDDRSSEVIIEEIKKARRTSTRFSQGL
jgi:hypothetical protein